MSRKMRNILLVGIGAPIIVIVVLSLFAEWAWGGDPVQTSLGAQYIPTAQALVQNPAPTPQFLSIYPPPGSMIQSGERLGVSTNPFRLSASAYDIANWTQIYVNNTHLAHLKDVGVGMGGPLFPPDKTYEPEFVFNPELQSGYHLVQIKVGTSVFDLLNPTAGRSYTWAYRVE